MAKIKIDGFIDELEAQLKKTIEASMRKHFEEGSYNTKAFYKTFKKELVERCNSWEHLPNKHIKNG